MPLAPIIGHEATRNDLLSALRIGRVPQVLLMTGATGVGKQRLALWFAQVLFCSTPVDAPCGRCAGCTKVLALSHPDLHWFIPVPRPKAGDFDKQIDEVAESIEAVIAERRAAPWWGPADGMSSHGVSSARLLQRHASMTPVEGGWRVFIIGDAERLVPQESSPEAANSLLKLLEEPPNRTLFVLTTSEPGQILPTIRSRSVPVRLGRLADADVRSFLAAHRPDLASDAVVTRAHGSIGAAIATTSDVAAKTAAGASSFLDAIDAGGSAPVERALKQGPWQARGDFTALLDALASELSRRTRRAADQRDRVSPERLDWLTGAIGHVLMARERAQGNINPQLLLASLADELATSEAA
jgi:DNA polymerase-3 subunit delta'